MRNQKPIAYDRKLRQQKSIFAALFPLFPENFVFPVCIFPEGVIFCMRGVWKGILFTAASIKATRGRGADFYRQHLANNDYYSEDKSDRSHVVL